MTEKSLPAGIEAERAVLGSVLMNRDAIVAIASWLAPDDFYVEQHAQIYEAMVACYTARIPPDTRTVADELRRRERLDAVGGITALTALVNSVPTSYHVEYYAKVVERTSLLRKLIAAGGKIAALGYDEQDDLENTLDKAEKTLFEVSQRKSTQDFIHIGQVIDSYYEQISYLQEHRGEVVGVPSGFRDLDALTGGLQPSDLIILAARPAVGKCLAHWCLVDDPTTGERLTIGEAVRRQLPQIHALDAAGSVRPAQISAWVDSGVKPVFRVRTRTGRSVDVTGHHPFLTVRGWEPLHDLAVGESIGVPRAVPCFGSDETWPIERVRLLATRVTQSAKFPDSVWRWSRRYLAEFIRVLMSCDGSIYQVDGKPRLEFTVAAPQLAADLHHALTRFGILAKCSRTTMGAWRVEVTEPSSVARYQQEIGWIGEKTMQNNPQITQITQITERLRTRTSSVTTTRPSSSVPLPRWLSLSKPAGTVWSPSTSSGGEAGVRETSTQTLLPSPAHGRRVGDEGHSSAPIETAIYWDEIVAIEAIGEHQVYDLTVPDGANFVAQDVLVHNTSFVMSMAYNVATQSQSTVGVFSLEMSRDQLVQRLLSMDTKIDTHKLRTGQITNQDLQTVIEAMGRLASVPIYIEDTPGLSIMDVRAKARRLQSQVGIDLIIIDYLQLMAGRKTDNRVQEVSEISRGLKGLARELNVPVIALSQLSRAVEGRQSHVPMLSDLRESGCLAGESLVYLPDEGTYRRIDELVGQTGFNVLALNPETWKLEPRPVTNAFATGVKPVYRMTTRLGRSIRATGNHKFLTISGWKRLDELTTSDRLALPRQLPGPQTPTLSDAELGLLGHLIGDGCTLPRQPIHYTTNDPILAEIVVRLATAAFGPALLPRISRERTWYQVYLPASTRLTHGKRNPIAAWFDQLGIFGLRSHEKRVPEIIFRQPSQQIAVFLRHLWATDGCVHLSVGKRHYAGVYYASSSRQLAQDVRSLLLRIGITARLSCHRQGTKGRDQWHVTVSGKTDIEQFFAIVGTIGSNKPVHQTAIAERLSERRENTNRDVLPREIWRLHAIPAMNEARITTRQMQAALGNAYCGTALYNQNLSRERATRLADVVQSVPLQRLAQSDVYWDEIVAIVPDGEAEVYDLTVAGLHNFAALDIIVHNSIEQDADIVMFIYREELYDKETDKKGIAELHIAKHRNGPIGVVPLRFDAATTRFMDLTYRTPEGY